MSGKRDRAPGAPRLGRPRLHLRDVDSTNERAKRLALAGAPHGTLVTAEHQSAGRGRQGRAWTAPSGRALLMSLVLRRLGEDQAALPLAAAVAVCEACERLVAVGCAIKWPNDVWIEERKVAGILLEGRPQDGWIVLGLGLNVSTGKADFPEELRDHATSLAIASPGETTPPVEGVLDEVLSALDLRLAEPGAAALEAWRARDALRGREVSWQGGQGLAAGIDDSGALLVETGEGVRALDAGEVHLTGATTGPA